MSLKISFFMIIVVSPFLWNSLPAGVQVLCLYTYETVDTSQAFCIVFFLEMCFFWQYHVQILKFVFVVVIISIFFFVSGWGGGNNPDTLLARTGRI